MDPTIDFLFYLAAVICLLLASADETGRYGRRSRRQAIGLLPIGIALAIVPVLVDSAQAAF